MKLIVAVLFLVTALATAAFAQDSANTATAPGCGAANAKFDVKTDKSQHPAVQPPDGKALVYFMEDDTDFESFPKPTTRIGVDGSWIGANHGNSYFSFAVDPGEHHLCASWQSLTVVGAHDTSAAAHFTAEPARFTTSKCITSGCASIMRHTSICCRSTVTKASSSPADTL